MISTSHPVHECDGDGLGTVCLTWLPRCACDGDGLADRLFDLACTQGPDSDENSISARQVVVTTDSVIVDGVVVVSRECRLRSGTGRRRRRAGSTFVSWLPAGGPGQDVSADRATCQWLSNVSSSPCTSSLAQNHATLTDPDNSSPTDNPSDSLTQEQRQFPR